MEESKKSRFRYIPRKETGKKSEKNSNAVDAMGDFKPTPRDPEEYDTNRRFYPNTSPAMRDRMYGLPAMRDQKSGRVVSPENKGQTAIDSDGNPVSGNKSVNGKKSRFRYIPRSDDGTPEMKDGGSLRMVEKGGEMVPFYAADGIGKMKGGGSVKDKAKRRGYGAARQPK